jgi:AcrR family transcriptional regulator
VAKQTYHHGDLRRALLEAAAEVINEQGPAGLSLRDLARRAGVSHAAPTHHFRDKAGLLTALAAEGYDLLATELTEEWTATHSFLEQGVAYVRFAIRRRAHFEVMFRPDLCHADEPVLAAARERAAEALYVGVSGAQPASPAWPPAVEPLPAVPGERQPPDLREAGLAAWSIAHGFATLWVSGAFPHLPGDPDQVARAVLRRLPPPTVPS